MECRSSSLPRSDEQEPVSYSVNAFGLFRNERGREHLLQQSTRLTVLFSAAVATRGEHPELDCHWYHMPSVLDLLDAVLSSPSLLTLAQEVFVPTLAGAWPAPRRIGAPRVMPRIERDHFALKRYPELAT